MPEAPKSDGQPTPEGTGAPEAAVQPTETAKAAADDTADVRAQLARVLKHKEELEADLHKYRKRYDEEMKKAKDAGDYAKLLEATREEKAALEAQLSGLTGDAEIGRSVKARAAKEIEEAKADPKLPSYVKRAIEAAKSPLDAAEILREFRATATTAAPPPAAALGAAPANVPTRTVNQMTPAEILSTPPAKLDELLGVKPKNGTNLWASFFGQKV